MAGVNTILRLIGGTIALVGIITVSAIGLPLIEAVYTNVVDPAEMQALGWGAPQDVVLLFMTIAAVALSVVVIIWWLVGPARDDVRQSVQRPPF